VVEHSQNTAQKLTDPAFSASKIRRKCGLFNVFELIPLLSHGDRFLDSGVLIGRSTDFIPMLKSIISKAFIHPDQNYSTTHQYPQSHNQCPQTHQKYPSTHSKYPQTYKNALYLYLHPPVMTCNF